MATKNSDSDIFDNSNHTNENRKNNKGNEKEINNYGNNSKDTTFNPEKEFAEIIARHEAKKGTNLKIKKMNSEEMNSDFSEESLLSHKISQYKEPSQQSDFHLNKKCKNTRKKILLKNAEPQPGTSRVQDLKNISNLNNEEIQKSNSIKIDNPFSDFSLKNLKLNSLAIKNEEEITKKIRQEVELQETLKKSSEINDEENCTDNEEEDNLIISWSSSDLIGIKKWSIFKKTVVSSNTTLSQLSTNNDLDNVSKKSTNTD